MPRPTRQRHLVADLHVEEALPMSGAAFRAPILMVHGAFHGWWAYSLWLDWFAAWGAPSYALSLRNHEGSRRLTAEEYRVTGISDYVDDIASVLDWLGPGAVLIGHSLGGLMVQKAAENRALAAVVCVGSASPAGVGPTRDFEWDEAEPLMFDRDRMRGSMFADIDDAAFDAIYARLVPESTRALNESGLGRVDVDPQKISAPMLFVGTEHDGIGLHPVSRLATFYGADNFTVAGTSHDLLLEPAGLRAARMIAAWLSLTLEKPDR